MKYIAALAAVSALASAQNSVNTDNFAQFVQDVEGIAMDPRITSIQAALSTLLPSAVAASIAKAGNSNSAFLASAASEVLDNPAAAPSILGNLVTTPFAASTASWETYLPSSFRSEYDAAQRSLASALNAAIATDLGVTFPATTGAAKMTGADGAAKPTTQGGAGAPGIVPQGLGLVTGVFAGLVGVAAIVL